MKQYFLNIAILFGGIAMAQIQQGETTVGRNTDIKDESVVVERVYEPKVEAAEKIKQTPEITDSKKEKLPVTYGLKDVEAESDFETSTITADELPVRKINPYNNYVRGGFGNRYSFLADGYAAFEIDEGKKAGASLNYYSSSADVRNTVTDSDELKLNAEGFLKLNFDDARADFRLGGGTHQLNYYGIDRNVRELIEEGTDVAQTYNNIYVAGKYETFDHLFLENVQLKAGYFSDKHDASESSFDLFSTLKNLELYDTGVMNDLQLGAKANINLNLANSKFEALYNEEYRVFNAGISPQITMNNDAFQINLGANIQYLNTSHPDILTAYPDMDKVHFFPAVDFSYNAIPEFGIYGGVAGGIVHNRYETLYNDNPFLLSSQELIPTKNKLEFYAGFRGDIGQNFKYDASAKFQDLENIPFFARYNILGVSYALRNSFSTIYDNGEKSTIQGRLNYTGISNLNLGTSLTLQSYKLDNLEEAWDKPSIKTSIDANYKLLNEKLVLGGDLFFIGSRKGTELNLYTIYPHITDPAQLPAYSLNSYIDLNLSATYMFLERWGAFLEIRNVLNKNYERYLDYEVQGTTGIGGVMFKF
ncbi:hypothetical protein GO491_09215 [Flavobacteriaceae bacterium Ap0902]|nr:hypothetical protein [Flavobacteriaceae bacterium Ap0902]